jgi:microcystin degradation protein MlrC
MYDFMWSIREPFANQKVPKVKEGIDLTLKAIKQGKRPVIIADHGDRTGDGTHILRELLARGASNFAIATIADPNAIREIKQRSGLGKRATVKIGGYATKLSGEPSELTGKVEVLGVGDYVFTGPLSKGRIIKLDTVAVLDLGNNNHVIITPVLHQVLDNAIFKAYGIDFSKLDIIVLKSRVHFRAFYQNVAAEIIPIDTPCLGPADLTTLAYKNVPQGLYPIGKKWRS